MGAETPRSRLLFSPPWAAGGTVMERDEHQVSDPISAAITDYLAADNGH